MTNTEKGDLCEVPFEVARNLIIMFLSKAYEIDNHLSDFIMSDEEVTELLDKIWEDGYEGICTKSPKK